MACVPISTVAKSIETLIKVIIIIKMVKTIEIIITVIIMIIMAIRIMIIIIIIRKIIYRKQEWLFCKPPFFKLRGKNYLIIYVNPTTITLAVNLGLPIPSYKQGFVRN